MDVWVLVGILDFAGFEHICGFWVLRDLCVLCFELLWCLMLAAVLLFLVDWCNTENCCFGFICLRLWFSFFGF